MSRSSTTVISKSSCLHLCAVCARGGTKILAKNAQEILRTGNLTRLVLIPDIAAIHSDEFKRDAVRIAQTRSLTRRKVASDLGIGHSTLGKWARVFAEVAKVPVQDAELLRKNERLRKENRILREERESGRGRVGSIWLSSLIFSQGMW